MDTNVVVHLGDLNEDDLPGELVISAISLAELSVGPFHARDDEERAVRIGILRDAEAAFDPLPFDTAAAKAFGPVSGAVLAAGRKPRRRTADLMIAATALVHDLPLYMMNPKDFVGLEQLLTVVPVERPASPKSAASAPG